MHSVYVPHVVCFLKTIIRTCGYRLTVVSLTVMCTSIFPFVSLFVGLFGKVVSFSCVDLSFPFFPLQVPLIHHLLPTSAS